MEQNNKTNFMKILRIVTYIFIAIIFTLFIIKFICGKNECDSYSENDEYIIKIRNPLDNTELFWEDSPFTRNNFPNYDYDIEEKIQIFEKCKNNKQNHGVIDVGAHIGDLAIPLAIALKNIDREDVIVYAIDPSPEKCNFMKKMSCINKIKNIKILNYGLSNEKKILSHEKRINYDNNTGSQIWDLSSNSVNKGLTTYDEESNVFVEADELFKKGEIGMIGVYHIDVEGHEVDVLKGSKLLINQCKPVLFVECWVTKFLFFPFKCKNKNECPSLFRVINKINSLNKQTGFLANGDLIFEV